MRFESYSSSELLASGQVFVRDFRAARTNLNKGTAHTSLWTECVLNWFAGTAAEGHRVDARSIPLPPRASSSRVVASALAAIGGRQRKTSREFLFDLCHSTWAPDDDIDYWTSALAKKPALKLVLESENGKANNGPANVGAVMEDAAKLLHVSAPAKVVVFASRSLDERSEFLRLAQLLCLADQGSESSWLWLDLPWPLWSDTLQPDGWLLASGNDAARPVSVVR